MEGSDFKMSHAVFYNIQPVIDLLPDDIEGKRILDVGTGTGQVVHTIMAESGREYVRYKGVPYVLGLDIDPSNIDFVRKWMPIYKKTVLWDALNIPYPTEFTENIDIIICTEVVEHFINKVKGIKTVEYLSTLAPLVIITCPDASYEGKPFKSYWENHNILWKENDFRNLGFKTKKASQYPKEATLILDIISKLFRGGSTVRTIVAWKVE